MRERLQFLKLCLQARMGSFPLCRYVVHVFLNLFSFGDVDADRSEKSQISVEEDHQGTQCVDDEGPCHPCAIGEQVACPKHTAGDDNTEDDVDANEPVAFDAIPQDDPWECDQGHGAQGNHSRPRLPEYAHRHEGDTSPENRRDEKRSKGNTKNQTFNFNGQIFYVHFILLYLCRIAQVQVWFCMPRIVQSKRKFGELFLQGF